MSCNCQNYLNQLADNINQGDDKTQRLEILLDFANYLPKADTINQTENLVAGCASLTYLKLIKLPNGTIQFQGTSDSLFAKSYMTILFQAFESCSQEEILSQGPQLLKDFTAKLNSEIKLLDHRANAFANIVNFFFVKVSQL